MTWAQKKVIFCESVTPAPDPTPPGCLAGEGYVAGIIYTPDSNPSLPPDTFYDIAGITAAVVVVVYLLAAGVGSFISLLRSRD